MQYEQFIETLSDKEKFILRNKCENLKEHENQKEKKQLSKSLQYKSINQIIRQWYQFFRLS
jgi:GTPase involved in cell partitioning and DNA repair